MKSVTLLSSTAVLLASPVLAPRMSPAHADHATPRADSTVVRADVDAADRALAAASARGALGALEGAFTDDVVLLYPGQPIARGRAIAGAVLESLPAASELRLTWRATRGAISADGTHAYTAGDGRSIGTQAADSGYVRYIAYWRRSGSAWRVAALLVTHAAAPAGASPACATRAESPPAVASATAVRTANPRRTLIATDSSFSARSVRDGAAAAFGAFIADDGASLGGGPEMLCGRDAVEHAMSRVGPGALAWNPRFADVAPSGDLGFTVGTATLSTGGGRSYSKYLTVWKLQGDGSWRYVADGGNSTPAP